MKRIVATAVASAALLAAFGPPLQAKATWVKKAQAEGFTEIKDCLACHTRPSGKVLNARGEFLAGRKKELGLKEVDLQWLKDYVEPTATPAADPPSPADPSATPTTPPAPPAS